MKRIIIALTFLLLLTPSIGQDQNGKLTIGNIQLELGQSFEVAFKTAAMAGYDLKLRENMEEISFSVIDIYEKNKIKEKTYKIGSFGMKKNKDTSVDGISKRKVISLIKYYDKELDNADGKSIVNVMFYALNYFHFNESKVEIDLTNTSPSKSKIIHLRLNQDGIYREVTISNMVGPDGNNYSGGTNVLTVTETIMKANWNASGIAPF